MEGLIQTDWPQLQTSHCCHMWLKLIKLLAADKSSDKRSAAIYPRTISQQPGCSQTGSLLQCLWQAIVWRHFNTWLSWDPSAENILLLTQHLGCAIGHESHPTSLLGSGIPSSLWVICNHTGLFHEPIMQLIGLFSMALRINASLSTELYLFTLLQKIAGFRERLCGQKIPFQQSVWE